MSNTTMDDLLDSDLRWEQVGDQTFSVMICGSNEDRELIRFELDDDGKTASLTIYDGDKSGRPVHRYLDINARRLSKSL